MKKDTEIVIFSSNIQSLIKSSYPNIVKLIGYNAEGLVKALDDIDGAVSAYKATITFRVNHVGTDNVITWEEYKTAIFDYLEKANDDSRLVKARESLAQQIWKTHKDTYPKWPSVGKTQSCSVYLSAKDVHDDGQYTIAWVSDGQITVTDEHPSENEYKAKLGGSPSLKILYVNKRIMKELEDKAGKDFKKAKEKVDSYTKSVGWD